jgi:uncharacterized SAM-binding protein YcdF (DUF218 family)
LRPDATPGPTLRRRVACAAELFVETKAPLLVLSGGGPHARPEAAAMRDIALASGVPAAAMLVETRSADTWENAAETAKLLLPRGIERIALVSDRYHLPRAGFLFRRAGLKVVISASPAGSLFRDLPMALRELLSLAKLAGKLLWLDGRPSHRQ